MALHLLHTARERGGPTVLMLTAPATTAGSLNRSPVALLRGVLISFLSVLLEEVYGPL